MLACGASLLRAQSPKDPKPSQHWTLEGLQAGYCVRFLIEPGRASKLLPGDLRIIPAGQDATLHSALRQVIRSQPEFGSWAPSNLCFYFTDAVQVGDRRVANKDHRKHQMFTAWTLAAAEKKSGSRRDRALALYAGGSGLSRAGEANRVKLREAHTSIAEHPDSSFDTYSIKLERVSLIWKGRATGDSTSVKQPIQEFWLLDAQRGGELHANFVLRPAWSRPMVGSLTVEGKGDLAKSLKASPIRFVGPFFRGGGGELELQ